MAFKDDMAGDLENVFFNPEEFADEHTFEYSGEVINITCVAECLTTDQAITRQTKHAVHFEGVSNLSIVVHVKTDELPFMIEAENICVFDGITYRVGSVSEDMGMTSIMLEVDTM